MLETNKEYEIEIIDIGYGGEGIGRVDGFTVFVDGAVTGDIANVKIKSLKKKFGIGTLIDIVKPSEIRETPICPVFDKCGGCQTQNIKYDEQLKIKRKTVKDAIERIGNIKDVEVEETVGMEEPYRYRNKGQYPVVALNGKAQIGFYQKKSHNIVEFKDCVIQPETNNEIIAVIKEYMDTYNIEAYNPQTGKGVIKHVIIKVGTNTNELMIIIVTNKKKLKNTTELIEMLQDKKIKFDSLVQNQNYGKTDIVLGEDNKLLFGKETITDTLKDLTFEISAKSFYQINPVQMVKLYDLVKENAGLTGEETVLDLYCGIGTIGLYLADSAKNLIGVESVEDAIDDAVRNAEINKIKNAEYYVGKAEEVIPNMRNKSIQADVVVVDPPRKGCEEKLLESIIEINPKKIVYVSCNPATLARDLKYLTEKEYKVERVTPVDMFPHTTHVESCTLLVRK